MQAFFKELGDRVLERWKRENFSLAKFPGIAVEALERRPPSKHVDLAGFMRDFLLGDEQPFQTDSPFGEPEIVAYSHPRFYIQLLFWMDGTTAIHQHEFSGAFHVMHGSSIHATYAFERARAVTPYLRVGDVEMKKIELLETGRTMPIVSGAGAIHSLFHLDSPSVTVVVRTQHDPGTGPQLNYLPPHVAVDPHHHDLLTFRRNQLLDVLEQAADPGYGPLVGKMIRELDFERGFHVMRDAMGRLEELGEWGAVMKAFEKKHGALAAGVAASLREEVRRGVIKGLRSSIVEPEHRFFLALLMNVPTRADLLKLVGRRVPGQAPVETVLRWAEELIEVSEEGVTLLDATFESGIEMEFDELRELFLEGFGHFLKREKRLAPRLRGLPAGELGRVRDVFARSALGVLL